MEPRPFAVTVISYLSMIIGSVGIVLALLGLFKLLDDPKFQEKYEAAPGIVWALFIILGVRLIIMIVAGHYMLEAANWARITYTCSGILYIVSETITALGGNADAAWLGNMVLQFISIVFLYLPASNRFFRARYYGV
jgi:small-conductance mechanosensitive channel